MPVTDGDAADQHPGETAAVRSLDLRATNCPMTFVRAKVALERLAPGQTLEIVLLAGEQMQTVPASLKAEGHRIERVTQEDRQYRLLVTRSGGQD